MLVWTTLKTNTLQIRAFSNESKSNQDDKRYKFYKGASPPSRVLGAVEGNDKEKCCEEDEEQETHNQGRDGDHYDDIDDDDDECCEKQGRVASKTSWLKIIRASLCVRFLILEIGKD